MFSMALLSIGTLIIVLIIARVRMTRETTKNYCAREEGQGSGIRNEAMAGARPIRELGSARLFPGSLRRHC